MDLSLVVRMMKTTGARRKRVTRRREIERINAEDEGPPFDAKNGKTRHSGFAEKAAYDPDIFCALISILSIFSRNRRTSEGLHAHNRRDPRPFGEQLPPLPPELLSPPSGFLEERARRWSSDENDLKMSVKCYCCFSTFSFSLVGHDV